MVKVAPGVKGQGARTAKASPRKLFRGRAFRVVEVLHKRGSRSSVGPRLQARSR
jgi:hypothetical protein